MKCPKDNFSKVTYIFLFFSNEYRSQLCQSHRRSRCQCADMCVLAVCAGHTMCLCVFLLQPCWLGEDCNRLQYFSQSSIHCVFNCWKPIALVLCTCISCIWQILPCTFDTYLWYIFNIHVFLPSLLLVENAWYYKVIVVEY